MQKTLVWTPQKCPNCKQEADWISNMPLRCPFCLNNFCINCALVKNDIFTCRSCNQESQLPNSCLTDKSNEKEECDHSHHMTSPGHYDTQICDCGAQLDGFMNC